MLSPSLSYTPFTSLLLYLKLFCNTFPILFNLSSTSATTFPHISRALSAWRNIWSDLFIPVFPFHNLFNLSSSQTINLSPPARCKLSISFYLLLFCMLVSPYTLCLFLFSLILPLHLSLQQLCVECKLHRERMSCDIALTLFTLINVSCYLAYVGFYWAWQQLINILSIDTHH